LFFICSFCSSLSLRAMAVLIGSCEGDDKGSHVRRRSNWVV
jgi:hypothetical protein